MPKYVLHYFPLGGRAMTARLMFTVAGVEFEDNLIRGPEWPTAKEDCK